MPSHPIAVLDVSAYGTFRGDSALLDHEIQALPVHAFTQPLFSPQEFALNRSQGST